MRLETLEVIDVVRGKYILQINLFDKVKRCEWALLVVYGAAHDENKPEFLAELSSVCHRIKTPYLVGGDFNIIRHCGKKIKRPLYHISRMSLMLSSIY